MNTIANNKSIFLVSATFIVIIVVFGLLFYENLKRWKCTENGCERIIGGDYKTKTQCETVCNHNTHPINKPPSRYTCTNNFACVESDQGLYSDKTTCENECIKPSPHIGYTNNPNYYYPQTLYQQPYYWQNMRPIRRGGGRQRRHHGRDGR
jgi:hypothetical protein